MVSVECRDLRRRLGPMAWTVLEDLALDAHPDGNGGFRTKTSARRVAGHLGVEPGTAANALRRLRNDGLVSVSREPGPAGRFGPSVYRVTPIPGLTIIDDASPRVGPPDMVTSGAVRPGTVEPPTVEPPTVGPPMVETAMVEPAAALTGVVKASPAGPRTRPQTKRASRTEATVASHVALSLWDTPSVG